MTAHSMHRLNLLAKSGMRFHASRGSMSVGESKGGLPPDSVVEDEAYHYERHATLDRNLS